MKRVRMIQIGVSILGIVLSAIGMIGGCVVLFQSKTEEEVVVQEDEPEANVEEESWIDKINGEQIEEKAWAALASSYKASARYASLQEAVNMWLKAYRHGAVGLEIYDVNAQEVVASYDANRRMGPRSIYKLFYLYDAYAQIDAGKDDPNQYWADGKTLEVCLDNMVRYSNNPCAEAMIDDPGRSARVAQLIAQLGLANTQSDGLNTSAHDVSKLLQYYYAHPEWSESSWQKFRETALNQPYTYRKGLPSGFATATVYSKAGWGGTAYNDAAMVELPSGQRYIVVVLTEDTGYEALRGGR